MTCTRRALLLLVVQTIALAALAQTSDAASSSFEFGRASGGEISVITKQPRRTSGSLGFTHSAGLSRGEGYNATLGGALLDDHIWFFASAQTQTATQQFGSRAQAIDAKITAQPVDWSTIVASYSNQSGMTPFRTDGALPSSFLSLRSTMIVSPNMTLDVSFSRQTINPPANP